MMEIRSLGENAYFVASNSVRGFYSYYGECFDREHIRRLYAIKGGPGTGKNRFMREVALCAEAHGWQNEYIYCSSDPDSLDGIILSKGEHCIAFVDATSPHVYEPTHPGFREELINLGVFWDAEKLMTHAEELEAWGNEKRSAYRSAYRYLAALGEMEAERSALLRPCVRLSALRAYAQKLMRGIGTGEGYAVTPALIGSIGMRGRVSFDTYLAAAERIFLVEDCHGISGILMNELLSICAERRLAVRLSHDPILPDRIDGIFLRDARVAFVTLAKKNCHYPARIVSPRRFLDPLAQRRVRSRIVYTERMIRALLDGALEEMQRVRELHFQIEEIYAQAMDFAAKEAFTRDFCRRLFDLQKEEKHDII